tara:strand:+ start:57 stop:1517 length:1461 start_codon:yes stop_codon:yes gene_type:complete
MTEEAEWKGAETLKKEEDYFEFIKNIRQAFPRDIITDISPPYLSEPRGVYKNKSLHVIKPKSTKEVSECLKLATKYKIGVVPWSGGTGLVGGQIAPNKYYVTLSMERMNKIKNFSAVNQSIEVEAGVILESIHEFVDKKNFLFPLSMASKGSCCIGGNLATNAGGIGVLKYGNARDLCLGLEVVLANGSIINDIKTIKKDNTGYDLKNLFIGSEGSLGIITRAVLRLYPTPSNKIVTFFAVQNFNSVLQSYLEISKRFGQFLQAFELISGVGLQFLEETKIAQSATQKCKAEWYVLMELGFNNGSVQQDVYEALDDLNNKNIIIDVIIGDTEAKAKKLWKIREDIPEANRKIGAITSHDISLPLENMESFINKSLIEIKKINFSLRVNCFGHVGDGNLHFNVFPPQNEGNLSYNGIKSKLTKIINDNCKNLGGSFSAEHGVGRLKVKDLKQYCDPGKFNVMCQIKKAIDPFAILNPGVILRQDTQD